MSPRLCVNGRTRAENVREALALHAEGLTAREIGVRLGVKRSTAAAWVNDPDLTGQKQRRHRYAGTCADCGGPTDGSNGASKAATRCATCAAARTHDERPWTPEAIVGSFRAYHERYGRSPTATDTWGFTPTGRIRLSAERLAEIPAGHVLPQPSAVRREFGSWRAALEAAGLPANRPGGSPAHRTIRQRTAARTETLALLSTGPKTITEIAAARRVNTSGVSQACADLRALGLVEWLIEPAFQGGRSGMAPGLLQITGAGKAFLADSVKRFPLRAGR